MESDYVILMTFHIWSCNMDASESLNRKFVMETTFCGTEQRSDNSYESIIISHQDLIYSRIPILQGMKEEDHFRS